MIFEFDRYFAKEAVELGLGRIITKDGDEVKITDWNYRGSDFYPIAGIISEFGSCLELWSEFGEYSIGNRTTFDLLIELFGNESNCL